MPECWVFSLGKEKENRYFIKGGNQIITCQPNKLVLIGYMPSCKKMLVTASKY